MNKQAIIVSVTIFVLIVVGMFSYTYIKKQELAKNQVDIDSNTETEQQSFAELYGIDSITAKKYYIDGKYTFVGEIAMPTPCDLVDVNAEVAESDPEHVTLEFEVINTADSCMQKQTVQRFLVDTVASEDATFSATFMGESVSLNIIPAGPNEKPEDFEVYIKG